MENFPLSLTATDDSFPSPSDDDFCLLSPPDINSLKTFRKTEREGGGSERLVDEHLRPNYNFFTSSHFSTGQSPYEVQCRCPSPINHWNRIIVNQPELRIQNLCRRRGWMVDRRKSRLSVAVAALFRFSAISKSRHVFPVIGRSSAPSSLRSLRSWRWRRRCGRRRRRLPAEYRARLKGSPQVA